MTDPWSERAELYRTSAAHVEGPDLDLIVEWAEGCETAIDVATGGGHVARRLREAGLEVVSSDPAPGMRPDVICFAEELPFADRSFDLAVTRVAAHHFTDPAEAARELGRVASRCVIVADTIYDGEKLERAEKLRDPSHVRNYSEAEWRAFLEGGGLLIEEVRIFDHPIELEPWLARTGCTGPDADAARELLADRTDGGSFKLDRIVLRARPA
jgi:SAM-dependent methyltransferase